jgi:acetyltransferase-like isoleucine patch superfamily enzyme
LKRLRKCGTNFSFNPNSTFVTPELLTVGNNVFIGEHAHISGKIRIGNNVIFGPRIVILDGNHLFAIFGKSIRFLKPNNSCNQNLTVIEDEVWCGAGVIILGGVVVGMGSVVGAGSVVGREIPPYVVAVGNPCRPIKKIFSDAVLADHLRELGLDEKQTLAITQRRSDALNKMSLESIPVIGQIECNLTA